MKGYKGTRSDMTCRLGFQYEIGKTYTHEGNIRLCAKGFHFCKNLVSCFNHYDKFKSRFFEVETGDAVFSDTEDKGVTNSIRLVREIKGAELNRIIYGYGNGDGYGDGYGNGDGDGYGYGYGYGNGEGYGYGNGNGYGYGYGDGDGNGYGYGYGYGYGNGYGYGDGDGYDIQKIINIKE